MCKDKPARSEFVFEIGIHCLFREVPNRYAGRTLVIAMEMVDFDMIKRAIGTDCRLRR
jgi:hypothetical protein